MKDVRPLVSTLVRRLSVVLVLVGLVAMLAGCNTERAEAVSYLNKGLEANQLGQTMEAVRQLKEAARIDPTYPEPSFYLAQIYHQKLDEPDNAERYYREAIARSDGQNPDYAYKLGTLLSEKGDHGEAANLFAQATQIEAKHAKAWFRKGLAEQAQGEYPAAVDSFMESIRANARMKMDEEDPGGAAYHALGDLYVRFGFNDKALKVYENALVNNPEVPRLLHGRGVAQLKLERFAEAADSFEKALELQSRYASATFNLAVAKNALGEQKVAVDLLNQFIQSAGPDDSARVAAASGLLSKMQEKDEQPQ